MASRAGALAGAGLQAEAARPLLEARDVTVVYGRGPAQITALRRLVLHVRPGELVGLVGPNGSGKTTLVRAATGAVVPQSGAVLLEGEEAAALSQRERARRVAVVPQNPLLPEAFTAFEAVMMGRTPHLRLLQNEGAGDAAIVAEAMRATDTAGLAGRRVGELSGGERQRVVVARALAQQARLLLLDEPTAHLDIGHQAAVLDLMLALCREESRGVLAAVHDLTLAAQYCDRLVLLERGEIAAEGLPDAVLKEELLERVYGVRVSVLTHPQTGRPLVAPLVGRA